MQCVEKQRLKKLADRKVKNESPVCRKCGNKTFLWDFPIMIKTCKSCNDQSGVI